MEILSTTVCRWSGCSLIFNDSEELLIHCTNDHIGRKSTNNLCLDCHWEGCDVKTTKRDHITSHLKVHVSHKPHVCPRCAKTFKRPQDLKKHEKLHMDGQDGHHQESIIFQPYSVPSSEFTPSTGHELKSSQRDLSPQSTSSEILATTPPSGKTSQTPQMNHYFNQLYNGIVEKQLSPQYNDEMSSFLNTLASSNDYSQSLQAVVNKDMDINYFNTFMGQLQHDITGNLGAFTPSVQNNHPNSYLLFSQAGTNMAPSNPPFQPNFPGNENSFYHQNNQAYYNDGMSINHQNYQQQMNVYGNMNLCNGVGNPSPVNYGMNMMDQGFSLEAPQVDYNMYPQYASMTVTPQRCEPSEFLDKELAAPTDQESKAPKESSDKALSAENDSESSESDSTSSDVDSLSQTLKNLELYSKEVEKKDITSEEVRERLRHAELISDLVAKVNSIYQALNAKPYPKKENLLSDLMEKKVQTPVTITSGSYPSLDDL
ncbi:hypothetical protein DSO57_1000518 [Entomophthora muscae]|uniref:Uncharacterized protein n=1 Tax=Entomophthora muscae TaxID=34485 RepID=A0ACC2RP54_9FUNG|nr:hypothetical protein DSO57_1000518 [Entomophthora muscae]